MVNSVFGIGVVVAYFAEKDEVGIALVQVLRTKKEVIGSTKEG